MSNSLLLCYPLLHFKFWGVGGQTKHIFIFLSLPTSFSSSTCNSSTLNILKMIPHRRPEWDHQVCLRSVFREVIWEFIIYLMFGFFFTIAKSRITHRVFVLWDADNYCIFTDICFKADFICLYLHVMVDHGLGVLAVRWPFHRSRNDSWGQRLTAEPPQLRQVSGNNQAKTFLRSMTGWKIQVMENITKVCWIQPNIVRHWKACPSVPQVRLVSELGKIEGSLQELNKMKAKKDVGQYSIEVIELF